MENSILQDNKKWVNADLVLKVMHLCMINSAFFSSLSYYNL